MTEAKKRKKKPLSFQYKNKHTLNYWCVDPKRSTQKFCIIKFLRLKRRNNKNNNNNVNETLSEKRAHHNNRHFQHKIKVRTQPHTGQCVYFGFTSF